MKQLTTKTGYLIKGKGIFLLIILLVTGIVGCKKTENPANTNENKVLNLTTKQSAVLHSVNEFGIPLFKNIASNNSANGNVFISPLSVYYAMLMAYNGASGNTAVEMKNAFGVPELTNLEISQSAYELTKILTQADDNIKMEIANSIWYRNELPVKAPFIETNQTYFDASVTACDFSKQATVDLINSWVNEKTHSKIPEIIDKINSYAVMYLINAIYFNGIWKYKFEENSTYKGFFYGNDTITSANFMVLKGDVNYFENDLFKAVELPYGNGAFSMVALLPLPGHEISEILQNFTVEDWNNWNGASKSQNVIINFPRFKFDYKRKLVDDLKSLGILEAFTDNADFSGISDWSLLITDVYQKSYIDVNENGTEAAAVTVVEIGTTAMPGDNNKYFVANKPFVFAIKDNTLNTILFAGVINHPVE